MIKYLKHIIFIFVLNFSFLFSLTQVEEQLFKAISQTNSFKVSEILNSTPDLNINVLDEEGYTPLHRAVFNNDIQTVVELLKVDGIDKNAKLDKNIIINDWYFGGATPLMISSFLGYNEISTILLDEGANIKSKDDIDGSMVIHLAAAGGNNEILKILLERYPNIVNDTDNRQNTALHWASMKDKVDTIKLLLENGADIEAQDIDGWTPLHYASAFASLNSVKVLVESGANVLAKTSDGNIPSSYAKDDDIKNFLYKNGDSTSVLANNSTKNEELSENKSNMIDLENKDDMLLEDEMDTVETQVQNVKNSNSPYMQTVTRKDDLSTEQLELLVAINDNDIIEVKNLLKNGVSPNFQYDKEGFSPLHIAILNENVEIVEALLNYDGIEKEARLKEGFLEKYNGWIIDGYTPILTAALVGNPQIFSLLMDSGCDIYAKDYVDGSMAIHIASANGRNDIIKLLLNEDKSLIDSRDNPRETYGSETPMHWAAANNLYETVSVLLDYDPDLKAQNSFGNTPLHYATAIGYDVDVDMVKIMVEKDAEPIGIKNSDGFTPLDFAITGGNQEVIDLLKSHNSGDSSNNIYNRNSSDSMNELKPEYKSKRDLSVKWWQF